MTIAKTSPDDLTNFFEEAPLYQRLSLSEASRHGIRIPKRLELPCDVCAGRARKEGKIASPYRAFNVEAVEQGLQVEFKHSMSAGPKAGTLIEKHGVGVGEVVFKC